MSLDRSLILICGVFLPCVIAAAQHPPAEIQAKIVPLFQSARQAEQRRDFSQAARLYDQILTLDPKLAEVWTNKGLVLHELDRHREALEAFARAASLKPDLITPQLFLGIEYVRLAEPQKALTPLEAVLAREPANKQALYTLAEANAHLERFRLAVNLYHELIRRDPHVAGGGGASMGRHSSGVVRLELMPTGADRKYGSSHVRTGIRDGSSDREA